MQLGALGRSSSGWCRVIENMTTQAIYTYSLVTSSSLSLAPLTGFQCGSSSLAIGELYAAFTERLE